MICEYVHVNILALAPQVEREFAISEKPICRLLIFTWTLDANAVVPCCAFHPGRPIQITKRENEVVVMCEEVEGFWHLAGVSSQEQFDAEQREATKFFKRG
jgi:hypothetical protein